MAEPACMTKRDLISYLLLDWRAVKWQIRQVYESNKLYPTAFCTRGPLSPNRAEEFNCGKKGNREPSRLPYQLCFIYTYD